MKERETRRFFDGLVTGAGIGAVISGALFLVGAPEILGTLFGAALTITGVLAVVAGIASLRIKDC